MKNLLNDHPWAGSFMGCGMAFAGVFGLKIVTDFVFNMAVLIIDHNRSNSESTKYNEYDKEYFEEE